MSCMYVSFQLYQAKDWPSISRSYGASTSQHGKLLYDDTQYLLALAIADHAIYGIETVDDFWDLQILPGQNELPLRWNTNVESLPILRNASMASGVTEEPLSKATFDKILKEVLRLSGYFGNTTVHTIRRDLGKELNSKPLNRVMSVFTDQETMQRSI